MTNPTDNGSAATPAAGGRFVGVRRRVVRTVLGHLSCDQCGNDLKGDECPYCAQRRRNPSGGGGLVVGVSVWADRGNTWSTLDRADDIDGEGWNPDPDPDGDDGEAGGWPW